MLSTIVAHLNKLEGVDLEPDFLSKSASGPWEILVTSHGGLRQLVPRKIQGRSGFSQGGHTMPDRGQVPNARRQVQRAATSSV